jgi:hypothetical protein
MKSWLYIAFLFLLVQSPLNSFAQNNTADGDSKTKFNREKWQELKGKIKYRKAPTEDLSDLESSSEGGGSGGGYGSGKNGRGSRKYFKKKEKEREEESSSSHGFSKVAQIIMIILAIFLIGLILYQLLFKNSSKTKFNTEVEEEIEEFDINTIQKSDLEIALENALKEEDYRKCIRVYFTFILKELSEKDLIFWEKDKTNFDYLKELKDQPEFHEFSNIVDIFDIIWYGKREIDAEIFKQLEPIFKNFLNRIGKE